MEKLPPWLSESFVLDFVKNNETPAYIYSQESIKNQIEEIYKNVNRKDFILRYAMKANTHRDILKYMDSLGLSFDASSEYEALHATDQDIDPKKVTLSSQVFSFNNMKKCVEKNVEFTATSLYQLETFGKLFTGKKVGIRLNPGVGSGSNNKLTTGGVNASFGIWHEYTDQVLEIVNKYNLIVSRIHMHIGSSNEADVWIQSAHLVLPFAKIFKSVNIINLGGGFKIARVEKEKSADMQEIISNICKIIESWEIKNNRKLILEIEPGAFLVANAGVIISKVCDIMDTGEDGHNFLRLDTGMTEILRPMLYGAEHPINLVPHDGRIIENNKSYIVVGHGCESGDTLTTEYEDPDSFKEIILPEAKIGDYIIIGGAGAYCASMSAKGYNMFPIAKEYVID